MAKKKIELALEDAKKIAVLLVESKNAVNIDPKNISLLNLWRVSGQIADKLLKQMGMHIVVVNGRKVVKPVGEETTTEKPTTPKPTKAKDPEPTPPVVEPTTEKEEPHPIDEVFPKEESPKPRGRKSKRNK